jgi:hypothetical protein
MTTKTERRRRSAGNGVFYRSLMARGAHEAEADVGLVRKGNGLLNA